MHTEFDFPVDHVLIYWRYFAFYHKMPVQESPHVSYTILAQITLRLREKQEENI